MMIKKSLAMEEMALLTPPPVFPAFAHAWNDTNLHRFCHGLRTSLLVTYSYQVIGCEKRTDALHRLVGKDERDLLVSEIIPARELAHLLGVLGSGFSYQKYSVHNKLSFVTVEIVLLHGSRLIL